MRNRTVLTLTVLAGLALNATATSVCYNTGSLGIAGNGTNTDTVQLDQPGVITAYGDYSTTYVGSLGYTTVPFLSQLNPASASPFTIEFWAKPITTTNDDVPVNNRISSGNRSGWVFFQRAVATGWNFRVYSGSGSTTGIDITGGTSTLGAWSHVVATWDGGTARLYVNGTLAASAAGTYAASSTAVFSVGALADGTSDFNGSVDEIAFYPSALSLAKIQAHYSTASSSVPGTYSSLVLADGAVEYLQQNPPFVKIATSGLNQVLTFTGILSQSADLGTTAWQDLAVTSPYTVTPSSIQPKMFYRAHR